MPMSQKKIVEALGKLRALVSSNGGSQPIRLQEDERSLNVSDLSPHQVKNHLRFMIEDAERMIRQEPYHREKVMRWLGNVQGCCWLLGLASIEELKDMNRPSPEDEAAREENMRANRGVIDAAEAAISRIKQRTGNVVVTADGEDVDAVRGRRDGFAGVAPRSSDPAYQVAYLNAKRAFDDGQAMRRGAESERL